MVLERAAQVADDLDGMGAAATPLVAATPADRIKYPLCSSSWIGQPSRRARRILQMASAMGLRQVFPVQTNRMITLEDCMSVAASTTPGLSMDQRPSSILTTVANCWILGRPGVDHHVKTREPAQRVGRRGDRVLRGRHHGDDQRRGE